MQLSDATFIVTDTETTGVDAKRNRIIEIAAVKVQGGEIVDRVFSTDQSGLFCTFKNHADHRHFDGDAGGPTAHRARPQGVSRFP